jgi:1,4-alpha-glucan branching enzyme
MFSYVGKKLLFMGAEIANPWEWNATVAMPWFLLDTPEHQGIHRALVDLNHLYRNTPALYQHDFDPKGFEWIDCHDAAQSVISYLRRGDDDLIVVALNFTPVPRHNYRIGVPLPGVYTEVFNSDSAYYGGSNIGNGGSLRSDPLPWMGQPHSVSLTLPPLAGVLLSPNKHSD